MFRTPIINQNERFLDIDEQPLVNGKVEVLDPVSNTNITIWSYSDDEYTEMVNPVRLDVEGRTPHTVFCDRIAYIRVYKYLGLDENNQPMFEFVRDYYAGENENTESREYVIGMDALRNLDPSINSSVNVLGYYQLGDCGLRTYVWDPNSNLDADNGYVVGSNVDASGRWILQFDGPYIPSTYYGVDSEHLSNAPALLSYASYISGKYTAPGVYFVPGHYNNTNWWNTTKKVLITSDSQFDAGIECSWIDVKGKPSSWLADIIVTEPTCPVHSCWYKNAATFWNSGSKYKYADGKNWTNNKILADVMQNRVHFYGGDSALTTDTNGYTITFDNCTFEGTGFLVSTMTCHFNNGEFIDTYYNGATIDPSKITFNQLDAAKPKIVPRHFKKPENLVKLVSKLTNKLDLDGVHVPGTADCSAYLEIRNGSIESLVFGQNNGTYRYVLKNVTITGTMDFNGRVLYTENSDIKLKSFPYLTNLYANDNSLVRSGWTLDKGTISCLDSRWQMNTTKDVQASFNGSIIESGTVKSKWISIFNSRVTNGKIEVYPYTETSPSTHYQFKMMAENSVFDTDIEFVPDGLWDIYFNVFIRNNSFNGPQGFVCPYWTDVSAGKRTIANYSTSGPVHYIQYEGNTGNCPNDRYYGRLSCAAGSWFDWNGSWARGKTYLNQEYKVQEPLAGYNHRYFLVEGEAACAGESFSNRDRDCGMGMLISSDTNIATVSLITLTEMITDCYDENFITWRDAHGYTPENFNDYFYRLPTLRATQAFGDMGYYDPTHVLYFW
jgi:hypothetical protein